MFRNRSHGSFRSLSILFNYATQLCSTLMKRKRDCEEILISSDSEDGEESEEDWKEDTDETDDEDLSDDEDEDDNGDDDNDDDDDGSLSDDEDEDSDDDYDDDEDTHSSDSEHHLGGKAKKRAINEIRDADSAQRGQKWTREKRKRTKGSVRAGCKTILSKEDQRFFSEALSIIRDGDLEKLKSEHCKAYLRRYSLRLAGSKSVLTDRVKEHIELKAHGGVAKYPRSTFTIDCTGDACTGDIVLFKQKVKSKYYNAGPSSMLSRVGKRIVAGRIVKESYGADKQQHTFTVEVLWSKGPKQLPFLFPLLIKGRNLYRSRTFRQPWLKEEERKRVLQEKHSRGNVARKARECRVSGSPRRTLVRKSRARVTLRRENKDTSCRERSTTSTIRSFVKDHNNRSHQVHRTLTIKACYAGILIGAQGRNIGAMERESCAQLRVRDHPSSPTLKIVQIVGDLEQVEVATRMVAQTFLSRGLPPPVETA